MIKKLSLQWKLTLMVALLVIVACLTLSFVISQSAILYMYNIGDSMAIIPEELFSKDSSGDIRLFLDNAANIPVKVHNSQMEFWTKSLTITAIITLISSMLVYFIVGFALHPLQRFGNQIQEIQAKNMQQPITLETSSIEIVRLGDAFNKMLSRLNDAFSTQKQFAANAAHELRTPIAVMQAKLEVFKKNKNNSIEQYQDAIDMVFTQNMRLSNVIDVLLEMTELQSAQKTDKISLAEVAEEVICDLAELSNKHNISITQTNNDAHIIGSDTLIYRSIYNLIENAIKYNIQGGKIFIDVQSNGKIAKVIVSDTGKGINKNDWSKIFEPFFRVDKSRSRSMGGAGLGLALVNEIAKQHGGTVRVVDSSPNGTTIEFIVLCNI